MMKKLLCALLATVCTVGAATAGVDLYKVNENLGRVIVGQKSQTTFQVGGFATGNITISLNGDPAFSTNTGVIKAFLGSIANTDVVIYFNPTAVGHFSTLMKASAKSASNQADFYGQGIVAVSATPYVGAGDVKVQIPGVQMSDVCLNAPVTGTSMTVAQMVGGYKATISGNGITETLTAAQLGDQTVSPALPYGDYTVTVELVPSAAGAAEWAKFEPYYDRLTSTVSVTPLQLSCSGFATSVSRSANALASPVDAPAGFLGNNAKWPVKFEQTNECTGTFQLDGIDYSGNGTLADLACHLSVNGVDLSADMFSFDPATSRVTVYKLPVDAAAMTTRRLALQAWATFTVDGRAYETPRRNYAFEAAAISAPAVFNPTLLHSNLISTGGFYQHINYSVYSLNLTFANTPAPADGLYCMGGVSCTPSADFYPSALTDGFTDYIYGTVGIDFDRTPRVTPTWDNVAGLDGYAYFDGNWQSANNWAALLPASEQFGLIVPHIFAQPVNRADNIRHGTARIDFQTYYPVVYDSRYEGRNGLEVTALAPASNGLAQLAAAEILPDNIVTGIDDIAADAAATPVYNLQGIRVGTADKFDTLPAGLYIVDGKKVIK